MTIKEIEEIYYINKEIRGIQSELNALKNGNLYKKNNISDMPKGRTEIDMVADHATRILELESMFQYNLKRLQVRRAEVENFLNTVENAELRLIIRLRAVNNMRWGEIGKEIGMERTTASKKFRSYFKNPTNPVKDVIL